MKLCEAWIKRKSKQIRCLLQKGIMLISLAPMLSLYYVMTSKSQVHQVVFLKSTEDFKALQILWWLQNLAWNPFYVGTLLYKNASIRSGLTAIKGLQSTRSEYWRFCIIKFQHKRDATPSFGVTMISEVPSNPQLTLLVRGHLSKCYFTSRPTQFCVVGLPVM